MASLKDLRLRIRSVQSTRKITSAMKMVAAANLRRAQDAAEAARPYAARMQRMIATLASRVGESAGAPELLVGREVKAHLVVVATADRGLCGGFNTNIVREARQLINKLEADGVEVKILCVGRKGRDQLRRDHPEKILETVELAGKKRITYADADGIAEKIRKLFNGGDVDAATLVYARFKSAMTQFFTRQQLIPAPVPEISEKADGGIEAVVEFEPDEEAVLAGILPRNLSVQIYGALLENAASEHGSRMTAMDSATRNAGDLIKKLNITYNRQRQATITKELIEIISGAEAL